MSPIILDTILDAVVNDGVFVIADDCRLSVVSGPVVGPGPVSTTSLRGEGAVDIKKPLRGVVRIGEAQS